MLFDDWTDIGRVVGFGVSGKRTLAKLNACELVVTVALASVLATIAISNVVSLADAAAAIAVLVAAQWAVSWASAHTPLAHRVVRAEATVVFDNGHFDDVALARMRLTHGEVCQAIRSGGRGDLEPIAVVVLEADGRLSAVTTDSYPTANAMPAMQQHRPRGSRS